MHSLLSDCPKFAELVEKYFSFLEGYGFKRSPEYEVTSGTLCQVVYLGKNVAITVYLDVRDNYVGVTVTKVLEGVLKDSLQGGFHADLGAYLRKRGRFRKIPVRQLSSPIETALAAWADYLQLEGKEILADLPESLSLADRPD